MKRRLIKELPLSFIRGGVGPVRPRQRRGFYGAWVTANLSLGDIIKKEKPPSIVIVFSILFVVIWAHG